MPAAVTSRPRSVARTPKPTPDARPPSKKTKLSQEQAAAPRTNGFLALQNGTPGSKPNISATINRVNPVRAAVNEGTAGVSGGIAGNGDVAMEDAIEISDDDEASSDDDTSSDEEADGHTEAGAQDSNPRADAAPITNGHVGEEDPVVEGGPTDPEELSFGERLRAQESDQEPEAEQTPHVVDVEAELADQTENAKVLTTTSARPLAAPPASSLGTVLTQALRTNDKDLLDSCLRVNDVKTVYATIERLPSPLVSTLLQRLAERLLRRPGRPGMLMVWVQWSLSAHGGYLAAQPHVVQNLSSLNKVLKQRASGLQPLLALKGRLDMLNAQLELRRRNQLKAAKDEMDEAVIYVEGEEEQSEDEEEEQPDADGNDLAIDAKKRPQQDLNSDDDESSEDEMPTTMEIDEAFEEGSEEEEEESEEEQAGLIDYEAEETDDDTGGEMSEDEDEAEEKGRYASEEEPKRDRWSQSRNGLIGRF